MPNQKASDAVQAVLDSITSDPKHNVPGLVFATVDKNGDSIQFNASGKQGVNDPTPMSEDTLFCIFSCTKLITTIAALQLVEQGKLKLDDAQHLYGLCPELEKKQILGEDGNLKDRKGDITLRMLLAHTAGFGYEFFDPRIQSYGRKLQGGFDVFAGDISDIYRHPLVNEPGSVWEYGINIDWAGIAVERATGLKLNDYFQKNIFQPLGLNNITMFPSREQQTKLARMHQKDVNGNVIERDHPLRRALGAWTKEEQDRIFNSGGGGCFARPTEYIQILATLLNDGLSPKTNHVLLQPSTIKQMFENQIPQHPNFARQGLLAVDPLYTNASPEMYPQEGNPPQGWGLSWFLTIEPGATGRGANTAWWAGISNLFFWVDREKGVAGMIASQMLPFGDQGVMTAWGAGEKAVYDNL